MYRLTTGKILNQILLNVIHKQNCAYFPTNDFTQKILENEHSRRVVHHVHHHLTSHHSPKAKVRTNISGICFMTPWSELQNREYSSCLP